jgi:hypothetical protein
MWLAVPPTASPTAYPKAFPLACYHNHPYPHNIKSHRLEELQDPERLRQCY